MRLLLSLSVSVVTAMLLVGASASTPTGTPAGLSPYGELIWNLDALVGDFYGGAHTCLRVRSFAIHRCSSPRFNDGDYRATFARARGSRFRAVSRSSGPNLGNVLPIKIGGRYIACGSRRWLAITNAPAGWGEPVACVTE